MPKRKASENKKAEITLTTERHVVIDQAAAALGKDPTIFCREGQLVRVVSRQPGMVSQLVHGTEDRVEVYTQGSLDEVLSRAANFSAKATVNDEQQKIPKHPPEYLFRALANRPPEHHFRHLVCPVNHPVLRPDGSLLSKPGWDQATGLVYRPGPKLEGLKVRTEKREAIRAARELCDIVGDFPFLDGACRSAWLAAALTPLARFAFNGPAPLFLADANCRGVGKTMLMNLIGIILTGHQFAPRAYTGDDDETRKVIHSSVKQGRRSLFWDNVDKPFGGASLCVALTTTIWEDRDLGANRSVMLPLMLTFYATSNNARLKDDMERRVCLIRLLSKDERPEKRQGFKCDPLEPWVCQHRRSLLSNLLTILIAYCKAGRPDMNLPSWGSYEAWSALVRGALVWAEQPDPVATLELAMDAADEERTNLGTVMEMMHVVDPQGHGRTTVQWEGIYESKPECLEVEEWKEFRGAWQSLVPKVNSSSMGHFLKGRVDRIIGHLQIRRLPKLHGRVRWAARLLSASAGDKSDKGQGANASGDDHLQ